MQLRPIIVATCVVLSGVVTVQAQLKSGPAVDAEVTGFKVHALTGEFSEKDKAKDVDFQQERQDKTTIYLFVAADKFDRPLGRYFKTLDQALVKGANETDVRAVVATLKPKT